MGEGVGLMGGRGDRREPEWVAQEKDEGKGPNSSTTLAPP